jgi:hypothetical protein
MMLGLEDLANQLEEPFKFFAVGGRGLGEGGPQKGQACE